MALSSFHNFEGTSERTKPFIHFWIVDWFYFLILSSSSSPARAFCLNLNPPEMATIVSHHHRLFSAATRFNSTGRDSRRQRSGANSVRCADVSTVTSENQRVTVSNRSDSLEICRVLNGMWQTSGGWGRIDRDDAVEAMLRYADAGLTTFDMADHCTVSLLIFSLLAIASCWRGAFRLACYFSFPCCLWLNIRLSDQLNAFNDFLFSLLLCILSCCYCVYVRK